MSATQGASSGYRVGPGPTNGLAQSDRNLAAAASLLPSGCPDLRDVTANPLILLQASPEQGSPRRILPSVAPAWARGMDRVRFGTRGEGTEQGGTLPGKTERGEPRSSRQGSDWDVEGAATGAELCARRLAHAGQLGDDLA